MGIQGLTSYINKHSSHCLQNYELQNTFLVIDGNNICYQIFYNYVDTCSVFGGDYDAFEEAILHFFDNLLACNVTPLVLLDGAYDILKMETILKRCEDRHRKVSYLTVHQTGEKIPPLQSVHVFKQALRKKNIRHAQCLFEADTAIASVAKMLKCPVLSFDSDFFIYGSLYIPFNTLSRGVTRTSNGKVIHCKIFDQKYLLNSFKGLNHRTLSLAAVILGQENIKPEMFKNFFYKLHALTTNTHNKIQETFKWLSKHTLDEAIVEILSGIPNAMRREILSIIEHNINDYTCVDPPAAVLVPLNLPKGIMNTTEIYKFQRNIENLPFTGGYNENQFKTLEKNENDILRIKNMLIEHRKEQNGNNSIVKKLPKWFLDEISTAKILGSLVNTIDKHSLIFPIQLEDFKCPTSSLISLKIVSVIYGLTSSIVGHKETHMKYVIRDQNTNLVCNQLKGTRTVPLSSLRELPIITRKEILDDTLGIKNMKCIDELLPEWKLYIACIKYWSDQVKLYKSQKCYAYSIIICILYNLYRQRCNCKPNYSENIKMAYREIDMMNCTSTLQFFRRYSQVQRSILHDGKVDMSIVHAFAQFQMCVLFAMDLNALLGYPYEEPHIAGLFNGTFLYNLCSDLREHKDVHRYINLVLKDSTSLLGMFNKLVLQVNPLLM